MAGYSAETKFYEREYASAATPDHPEILARWAADAQAFRSRSAALLDVPYGAGNRSRLDFFAARTENAPLFIFIHGGWWKSLDKSDFSWIARPFVDAHVNVAVMNYGLAPVSTLDDMVRQLMEGVACLFRAAERYHFDREQIVIGGHSAGAHLAAMLLCSRWDLWAYDLPTDVLKGAVLISGIYDLAPLAHVNPLQRDLLLDDEVIARCSPVRMQPATQSPVLLAVGGEEAGEFHRQTGLLREAWQGNTRPVMALSGRDHLGACEALGDREELLAMSAVELCLRPYALEPGVGRGRVPEMTMQPPMAQYPAANR